MLLAAGLVVLMLPEPSEGPLLWQLDAHHTVRAADLVGGGLLLLGSVVAWSAGASWQQRMYAA